MFHRCPFSEHYNALLFRPVMNFGHRLSSQTVALWLCVCVCAGSYARARVCISKTHFRIQLIIRFAYVGYRKQQHCILIHLLCILYYIYIFVGNFFSFFALFDTFVHRKCCLSAVDYFELSSFSMCYIETLDIGVYNSMEVLWKFPNTETIYRWNHVVVVIEWYSL